MLVGGRAGADTVIMDGIILVLTINSFSVVIVTSFSTWFSSHSLYLSSSIKIFWKKNGELGESII